MEQFDLYKDISQRTNGDIYIGVVGPVRSGKSTFIKKFMDLQVLPNITDENEKMRTLDELPQSGSGKTIMTTQPKFVPNEAVSISLDEHTTFNVRLVDCVGYLIDGILGHTENDMPRMVMTPWSNEEMPFEKAAEIGTRKVICDHSTIGMVITSDGSFTGLSRSNYIDAEERVINELKALGKPFIVILNTNEPYSVDTQKLIMALEEKYGVPVLAADIQAMELPDIQMLLEKVLFEFPLRELRINIPRWMQALDGDHPLIQEVLSLVKTDEDMLKMRDYSALLSSFSPSENIIGIALDRVLLGEGAVSYTLNVKPELFYSILGAECGVEIKGDYHLITMMRDLINAKKEYDRIQDALEQVRLTGYGVVSPSMDEMTLEEPKIVKQGGHFGVKLKASAPSLHLMQVDISTEINPIVGSEKQSEELVKYLMSEFENDPQRIWESNMFGKSLHSLVMEGLDTKLNNVPPEARSKIKRTMERIVNDGGGGLICILL
ncbi:MAG: stage IV sporulation protein A [Clostridia bacterium]|nr:stage IV sporulation protein A [Clostridia bacterium]